MYYYEMVKKHVVDQALTKEQILNICQKFPHSSINLSFKTDYGELKVKEKAPKSGKSGKGGDSPKIDYCIFTTTDKQILDEVWDKLSESTAGRLVEITHQHNPWIEAYKKGKNSEIDNDSMISFYERIFSVNE